MNNKNMEKLLPIGTVVLLKNGKKRIMITGYFAIEPSEKNKVYDYSGVLFPEGILSTDNILVFNHEQIIRVDYLGLIDKEQQEFIQKIKKEIIK